jgi:hypothetical protein
MLIAIGLIDALVVIGVVFATRGADAAIPLPIVAAIVLVIPLAIVVGLLARRVDEKRLEEVRDACADRRWPCDVRPDAEGRRDAYASIAHLHGHLRSRAEGIAAIIDGSIGGRTFRIVEHRAAVTTDEGSRVIDTIVITTPCPAAWPSVVLSAENLLHWAGNVLGLRDLQLEREAFNRRWRVRTHDESFATLLLDTGVQAFLERAPNNEWWEIGNGVIACIHRGELSAADLDECARRPLAFARLLPPELDLWLPADSAMVA